MVAQRAHVPLHVPPLQQRLDVGKQRVAFSCALLNIDVGRRQERALDVAGLASLPLTGDRVGCLPQGGDLLLGLLARVVALTLLIHRHVSVEVDLAGLGLLDRLEELQLELVLGLVGEHEHFSDLAAAVVRFEGEPILEVHRAVEASIPRFKYPSVQNVGVIG